jgi:probable addiction module antidote protein
MSKAIHYNDYLMDSLKSREECAAYLNAALQDGDLSVFTLALRDVVNALGGGIGNVSIRSHLNRESLYKMLSKKGNPRLSSLNSVMNSLDLEIYISPKQKGPETHAP